MTKQSKKCSQPSCKVEFGISTHRYICDGCRKTFCDDHCCNASYLCHLSGDRIDLAKKNNGYLCSECLQLDGFTDPRWIRCIIDRKCAHDRCSASLNDWTTIKRSCVVCGQWVCSQHSYDKDKFPNTWLIENSHYEMADAVCDRCGFEMVDGTVEKFLDPVVRPLRATGSDFLDEVNHSIETLYERYEGIKKELRHKSIIFGLRASLAALACSFIVFFAPNLRDLIQSGQGYSFTAIWSMLGMLTAGVFLTKEFIIPGIKLPEARNYAYAMIAGVVFTIVSIFV